MSDTNKPGWREISAERYDEMLNVLPPLDWTGGKFLVGEPMSDRDGAATYSAFVEVGGRYFTATEALTRAEFRWVAPGDVRV